MNSLRWHMEALKNGKSISSLKTSVSTTVVQLDSTGPVHLATAEHFNVFLIRNYRAPVSDHAFPINRLLFFRSQDFDRTWLE